MNLGSQTHPTNPFIEFSTKEVEQSIPDRFEKIVRMYPGRLAVKTEDQALSYGELNRVVNRLARAILAERGEGNEPVAILLEHGIAVLVAVMAILKAGKIYVPLDPSYPIARLRYMTEDSQAALVLTNDKNRSLADELASNAQVVSMDKIDADASDENLRLSISPDAFAYILYTSGSTGQPKGVVETHRNVLHGVLRVTNGLHISATDQLSFTHSCSSSASVRRIFPAFLNGASLHPLDVKKEGMSALANLLIREEITVFSSGRVRDFLAALNPDQRFPKLRLVSFGGELVHKKEVDLARKFVSPECLVGIWMSTTETGSVTQYFIDKQTQIETDIVPIGFSVEGVEVLLLDELGQEIDAGEVGEIAVKSRYLSPGYWRKPELTEAKFLRDPRGGEERMYLTGDLGRKLPDGCLIHLGRKDAQVKIRGYRIEVAEIEAALLKLDDIKKAFVTVLEKQPGIKSLVAYLVLRGEPVPTIGAIRRALAEKLPSHMIPSVFVMLDSMPLTPTGKIDRRALPVPEFSRPELDTAFVPPRTRIERELAQIWAEVLSIGPIGIHDKFLEMGGDSLLAVRVLTQVIERFQVEMSIQSFLQSPTVAEMAVIVTQQSMKRAGKEEILRILAELESISDEDAERRLSGKTE
ncbi:MAG TPA: non-ribosomal peptide synthetase [Candidatus Binatia bacterium]|jgi:amino acid adenylation domain-containing protein|nr:non-ribosomal peptide synthetase [Candidatus Binatia bacterium]